MSVKAISVTQLQQLQSEGGNVLHAMKKGDEGFVDFGEVYFSTIDRFAVKAWKKHFRMTLNLVVPVGTILFVFVDEQGNKREETIGAERYVRLTVPPQIWFGLKGIGDSPNILMNVSDIMHDPNEVTKVSKESIEHDWIN